jgi:hypothetical protein
MSELTAAIGPVPAGNAPAGSKRDEEPPLIASPASQRKRSALKVASGALKAVHRQRTPRTVAAAELPERPVGRLDAAMAARPAVAKRAASAAKSAAPKATTNVASAAAPKPTMPAARKTAAKVASAAAPKSEKPAAAHNHPPARRTRGASAR